MKLIRPKVDLSANVAVGLPTCMHCVGIGKNKILWKCNTPHEKGRGYANILWVITNYDGCIVEKFEGFSTELPENFAAIFQERLERLESSNKTAQCSNCRSRVSTFHENF
jgi:hypothetical protein